MKASQLFTRAVKTIPADETAKNAQLLIKAGFIHKEMSGVYAYLPLGLMVLENIKKIVREEMNAVGGQEVMMTALQSREIWEKTDRWDDAKVDNWFKTKLVSGAELGVGLTHEEPVVDAVGQYVSSYKDLPLSVYQIQSKFRNELRAKSGLLRGREFVMKDMYSFSRNQEEHDIVYELIAAAYSRVYDRLGIGNITFRTKADGGIFTEKFSDEYQTLSPVGEDTVFCIEDDNIYFNQEVAPSKAPSIDVTEELLPKKEIVASGVIGVDALVTHLQIPVTKTTKTLLYKADNNRYIAAVVRGDYDINELKLIKIVGAKNIVLCTDEEVLHLTGVATGYAGLLHLPESIERYVDESCQHLVNFETGANAQDVHVVNVNWERDIALPKEFFDIKIAKEGDLHPGTGKAYTIHRGVEVGNIFPLESKYTDALGVYYTNEQGIRQSIIMGCYGIGVSRLMGVLAEHFADDKGLVWPESVSPFKVYLCQLGSDTSVMQACKELYEELSAMGITILWDDRDIRPGEKFADADVYGIPYRVVISQKTIAASGYEVKLRTKDTSEIVNKKTLITLLAK